MVTRFPRDAYEKFMVEQNRSMGKYIANSASYVGKKAQITMGKSIGATRYDFKFDFEKCKKIDYAVLLMDESKKLAGSFVR